MNILERLKLRTEEPNEAILLDCMESAKHAILERRFPYRDYPTRKVKKLLGDSVIEEEETYVEPRYEDLQFRMALDLYNKTGAEGQLAHSENGVSRSYESSWISEQLLGEVTPYVEVTK